jgi:hypothetical protein
VIGAVFLATPLAALPLALRTAAPLLALRAVVASLGVALLAGLRLALELRSALILTLIRLAAIRLALILLALLAAIRLALILLALLAAIWLTLVLLGLKLLGPVLLALIRLALGPLRALTRLPLWRRLAATAALVLFFVPAVLVTLALRLGLGESGRGPEQGESRGRDQYLPHGLLPNAGLMAARFASCVNLRPSGT